MITQETTKFNKSSFIRSRPDMTVQEIIDDAEKMGQTISPGTIWTLRSADKRKANGKKAKKAESTSESPTTTPKTKKVVKAAKADEKKFNKSSFIRRYPKLSAGDIIFKAKALGQDITTGMIYTLRSSDRKKGEEPAKKVSKKVAKASKTSKKVAKKSKAKKSKSAHASISFDPSDPVARKLIAAGLAAT